MLKGKNMIFISIARNYAENRKLRGRLLITWSVSRSRNRVLGWALAMATVLIMYHKSPNYSLIQTIHC